MMSKTQKIEIHVFEMNRVKPMSKMPVFFSVGNVVARHVFLLQQERPDENFKSGCFPALKLYPSSAYSICVSGLMTPSVAIFLISSLLTGPCFLPSEST